MNPAAIRDYQILKYIMKNEGVALSVLIGKFGKADEDRVLSLESQKLISHTSRTYDEYETILDLIGEGNNHFKITKKGIIVVEDKKDIVFHNAKVAILGFLAGIVSGIIIGRFG